MAEARQMLAWDLASYLGHLMAVFNPFRKGQPPSPEALNPLRQRRAPGGRTSDPGMVSVGEMREAFEQLGFIPRTNRC